MGDLNPVEEVCPLKAIFFGKDFEVVFKKYETECPEEWSSNQGCWVLVGAFLMQEIVAYAEHNTFQLGRSR